MSITGVYGDQIILEHKTMAVKSRVKHLMINYIEMITREILITDTNPVHLRERN